MTKPTVERLKQVFHYDRETGLFTRLEFGSPQARGREQNRVRSVKDGAYLNLSIDGRSYRAHNLAWLYFYGEWPKSIIDHIDRNRTNNRIDNLRLSKGSLNQINTKVHKHNTSGITGVSWSKTNKKWTASIYRNNKRINLGYFDTREAAHAARLLAVSKFYVELEP